MLSKWQLNKNQSPPLVNNVEAITKAKYLEDSAQITAGQPGEEVRELITFKGNVAYVELYLTSTDTTELKHAPKIVQISSLGEQEVYNLEVDGTHSYLDIHGILHHNCMDAMRYCSIMTLQAHNQRAPNVPSIETKKSDNPFENIIKRKRKTEESWT
jgi:hypothetical protein